MQPTKILIVEDDASIREMYVFKLVNSGFDVQVAEEGKQGIMKAKDWLPDLILLDLHMPVMGGAEMLKIMRSKEWGANIRVIILTNISKTEAPSELRFLAVDRYIVKAHSTPSEIISTINTILPQTKK